MWGSVFVCVYLKVSVCVCLRWGEGWLRISVHDTEYTPAEKVHP